MALTMLFLVIAFVLFLLLDWIRDNAESRAVASEAPA